MEKYVKIVLGIVFSALLVTVLKLHIHRSITALLTKYLRSNGVINFVVTDITRKLLGHIDAPRLLERLSIRVPGNIRLQVLIYQIFNF